MVLGPPGTGKTTHLMKILDRALRTYDPRRVCFVAFTRKAAQEAITRATDELNLTHDDLIHFRTLHSFAFKQLGMSSKQMMMVGDYINIARSLGLTISYRGIRDEGSFFGQTRGDRILFLVNIARLQKKTLAEIHAEWAVDNISFYELQVMHETIEAYKLAHGKKDFTDIIEEYVSDGWVPDIDLLLVDEAQDLAPVQWDMVFKLAENTEQVYVAGDDDQAIFKWAGADVDKFIHLPVGSTRVLDRSYRVPFKIATCANRVIAQVRDRHKKVWKPRIEQGTAKFVSSFEQLNMDEGSWMLLARNSYLLEEYQRFCMRKGYVFESTLESPIDPSLLQSIRLWERLRRGRAVTVLQAQSVYQYMSTKVGVQYGFKTRLNDENPERLVKMGDLRSEFGLIVDGIWHESFDRIPDKQRDYLLAALRRGEKIDGEPRVRISTIHGVKGGQADNVVLFLDMALRTYKEFLQNPQDEARVWYVGITRAKEGLYVVYPRTSNHYPLDTILRSQG